jgi:hypothetical protein
MEFHMLNYLVIGDLVEGIGEVLNMLAQNQLLLIIHLQ